MTKGKRTAAQEERQAHRKSGGRYSKVNPCERCGKSAGVEHCSDDRCNTLGYGLVLCDPCGLKLADMDDASYLAEFRRP